MPELTNHLLQFGGTECTHCHEMDPIVERLQKEDGITLQYLESWHNEENAKLLEELDSGKCGGVPFFYNTKTKKFICGACDYETLKAWAVGQ
jgi:thiol-disulfide isomerase/thioredoxin